MFLTDTKLQNYKINSKHSQSWDLPWNLLSAFNGADYNVIRVIEESPYSRTIFYSLRILYTNSVADLCFYQIYLNHIYVRICQLVMLQSLLNAIQYLFTAEPAPNEYEIFAYVHQVRSV